MRFRVCSRQRRRSVETGCTVELFAQNIDLPDVPGGLFDHVQIDPAQGHPAEPLVRHRVIQRVPRGNPPGPRALLLVLSNKRGQLVFGQ